MSSPTFRGETITPERLDGWLCELARSPPSPMLPDSALRTRVVVRGRLPWSPELRRWLDRPWALPLLGAALLWDRTWALDRLLGDDPSPRFAVAVRGTP